jgi:hypothetical protein
MLTRFDLGLSKVALAARMAANLGFASNRWRQLPAATRTRSPHAELMETR